MANVAGAAAGGAVGAASGAAGVVTTPGGAADTPAGAWGDGVGSEIGAVEARAPLTVREPTNITFAPNKKNSNRMTIAMRRATQNSQLLGHFSCEKISFRDIAPRIVCLEIIAVVRSPFDKSFPPIRSSDVQDALVEQHPRWKASRPSSTNSSAR